MTAPPPEHRGAGPVAARVLGPVEVRVDGAVVPTGPPKQRALLALLLLWPGELVSTGSMIRELWDGRPPRSAPANLRTYLGRIRTALGGARDRLVARPDGQLLRLDPGELDLTRFAAAAARGR
ncbi:AfsR/SARP family transcriptional regulator, partial [Actinocatenispora thailandica]